MILRTLNGFNALVKFLQKGLKITKKRMVMNGKIIGVIQARMASNRLPGKVLEKIMDEPMIWHIYKRLQNIPEISEVVISTTNKKSDKPLRDFLNQNKISYYAGSQDDILDRLYHTGKKFHCDVIVKINADCPLIDYNLISKGIKKIKTNEKIDLVTNCLKETFPEGMQYGIFNFKSIQKLWNSVKDPFWREYIFRYFLDNKNKFTIVSIENSKDLSSLRWVVDYQEDLDFVRKVYEKLYKKNPFFGMKEILKLIEREPKIVKINKKFSSKISIDEFNTLKNNLKKSNC